MTKVLPDDNAYLRRLWDALDSPYAYPLAHILGDLQKNPPPGYDWKDFVVDVMEAMELDDADQFPDSWRAEEAKE